MTIVDYNNSHRADCVAIFKSNTPKYFDPSELPALENWLNGKDKAKMSYQNNKAEHFYSALESGKTVACGGFYIPENKKVANLVWGMVHNSLHKNGIGKKMFEYRVQKIKQFYHGHAIVLDTSQHTFVFFENLGFVVSKITKNGYGPGLHRYDMELAK